MSKVTTLQSAFYQCYSLRSLDVSGWDVSKVTTLQSAFYQCYSLRSLDVSGWDVSKVTTLQSAFSSCYSLRSLDVSGWDVSKVTTLQSAFSSCHSMGELDLSGWDLAACTNVGSAFRYMRNLRSVRLCAMGAVTAATYLCADTSGLHEVWPPAGLKAAHSYSGSALTHASLLRIIDALPQVTSATTLSLGSNNLQLLTAAEKLVATNKGWTLAN